MPLFTGHADAGLSRKRFVDFQNFQDLQRIRREQLQTLERNKTAPPLPPFDPTGETSATTQVSTGTPGIPAPPPVKPPVPVAPAAKPGGIDTRLVDPVPFINQDPGGAGAGAPVLTHDEQVAANLAAANSPDQPTPTPAVDKPPLRVASGGRAGLTGPQPASRVDNAASGQGKARVADNLAALEGLLAEAGVSPGDASGVLTQVQSLVSKGMSVSDAFLGVTSGSSLEALHPRLVARTAGLAAPAADPQSTGGLRIEINKGRGTNPLPAPEDIPAPTLEDTGIPTTPKQVQELVDEVAVDAGQDPDDDTYGAVKWAVTKVDPPEPRRFKGKRALELTNDEMTVARAQYDNLLELTNIYRRARAPAQFVQSMAALRNLNATIFNLANQKAIILFQSQGDPRMLQQLWTQKMGEPVEVIPRSDGLWDVLASGKLIQGQASTDELASIARKSASNAYAIQAAAAIAERDAAFKDAQWKTEMNLMVQELENKGKLAIAELQANKKLVVGPAGGLWLIAGGKAMRFSDKTVIDIGTGKEIEKLGVDAVTIPTASAEDAKDAVNAYMEGFQ